MIKKSVAPFSLKPRSEEFRTKVIEEALAAEALHQEKHGRDKADAAIEAVKDVVPAAVEKPVTFKSLVEAVKEAPKKAVAIAKKK